MGIYASRVNWRTCYLFVLAGVYNLLLEVSRLILGRLSVNIDVCLKVLFQMSELCNVLWLYILIIINIQNESDDLIIIGFTGFQPSCKQRSFSCCKVLTKIEKFDGSRFDYDD